MKPTVIFGQLANPNRSEQVNKTNKHLNMTKYILSVDGGGIRGIIPAIILAEIEKRTSKTISEIFHLMAGTSTGGIVVAGLRKKDGEGKPQYSASDLVNFYQEYGPYIFKSSFLRRSIFSWLNGAQYPYQNIENVLHKYFGDATLADVSNNLLLTSYDIHNNCPFFFKNWKEDRKFIKLKDALRATTAAPTYFAPKYLKINDVERVLVDGGVFANNPAACSYETARNYSLMMIWYCFQLVPAVYLALLNMLTQRNLGKITWVKPLLNVMFASGLDCVNYQLSQINYVF